MDFTARMMDCDFDYDGFAGGPYEIFLRWNGIRYGTLEEAKQRAPVLKHAVLLTPERSSPPAPCHRPTSPGRTTPRSTFASRLARRPSMPARLCPVGTMVFGGFRPDLGAYELGDSPP